MLERKKKHQKDFSSKHPCRESFGNYWGLSEKKIYFYKQIIPRVLLLSMSPPHNFHIIISLHIYTYLVIYNGESNIFSSYSSTPLEVSLTKLKGTVTLEFRPIFVLKIFDLRPGENGFANFSVFMKIFDPKVQKLQVWVVNDYAPAPMRTSKFFFRYRRFHIFKLLLLGL